MSEIPATAEGGKDCQPDHAFPGTSPEVGKSCRKHHKQEQQCSEHSACQVKLRETSNGPRLWEMCMWPGKHGCAAWHHGPKQRSDIVYLDRSGVGCLKVRDVVTQRKVKKTGVSLAKVPDLDS